MNHAAPEDWQAELRAAEAKGYARGQEDFRSRVSTTMTGWLSKQRGHPAPLTGAAIDLAELEILPLPERVA